MEQTPGIATNKYFGTRLEHYNRGSLELSRYRYQAGAQLAAHSHVSSYLCLVERGRYEENVAGHRHIRSAGDVILHPAGELHANSFGDAGTICCNVAFPASWSIDAGLPGDALERPGVLNSPIAMTLSRQIIAEAANGDDLSRAIIDASAINLVALFNRRKKSHAASVARAVEMLNDSWRAPPGTAELAKAVSLSRTGFIRAFRRAHGCSPHAYARDRRVRWAALQIASGVALTEVAFAAGFADQSHMGRAFKRVLGVTPGEVRRA